MKLSNSQRRRLRSVRRRVGQQSIYLGIAVTWVDQDLIFHYRQNATRSHHVGDNAIRREVARQVLKDMGYIQQEQPWLWIHQKATITDIALMSVSLTVTYEEKTT